MHLTTRVFSSLGSPHRSKNVLPWRQRLPQQRELLLPQRQLLLPRLRGGRLPRSERRAGCDASGGPAAPGPRGHCARAGAGGTRPLPAAAAADQAASAVAPTATEVKGRGCSNGQPAAGLRSPLASAGCSPELGQVLPLPSSAMCLSCSCDVVLARPKCDLPSREQVFESIHFLLLSPVAKM